MIEESGSFVHYRFFKDSRWSQLRVDNPISAIGLIQACGNGGKQGKIEITLKNKDKQFIYSLCYPKPPNEWQSPPLTPDDLPCIEGGEYILIYGVYKIINYEGYITSEPASIEFVPGTFSSKFSAYEIKCRVLDEPRLNPIGTTTIGSVSYFNIPISPNNAFGKYLGGLYGGDNQSYTTSPIDGFIYQVNETQYQDFLALTKFECGRPEAKINRLFDNEGNIELSLVAVIYIDPEGKQHLIFGQPPPKNKNLDDPYYKLSPEAKVSKDCPSGFIKCLSDCPDGFCCVEDCK